MLSEHLDAGRRHVALDLVRCVFRGRFAEDPWAGAITMGQDFELAARCRNDLRLEVVADDPSVPAAGPVVGPAAGPTPDPDAEAARASAQIHRMLGRSLHLRQEPHIVIAVGACAASGGIVGEGYASAGGVDRVLPVDVYIPGCPPRPEAIIFGILLALGRLDARRLPGDSTS